MQANLVQKPIVAHKAGPITKRMGWSRILVSSILAMVYAKVHFCRVAMAAGNGLRGVT